MYRISQLRKAKMCIETLLEDNDELAQISDALIQMAVPLIHKKACNEVAGIVAEMLR